MRLHFLSSSLGHYLFLFYHDFENGVRACTFFFFFIFFVVQAKSDNNNSSYTYVVLEYKHDLQPKIVMYDMYN